MNYKLALIAIVLFGISIDPATAWLNSVRSFFSKAGNAIKKGASTAGKFVQKHPEVVTGALTTAALLDEEILDTLKALKARDENSYDLYRRNLRFDLGDAMTEDELNDFERDLDKIIEMDASEDRKRLADEIQEKFNAA